MFSAASKAKTCSLWLKELWLERADAKPWGRSPSRWTPCWPGRAARGFSPMSPACWPKRESRVQSHKRVTQPATTLEQQKTAEQHEHA